MKNFILIALIASITFGTQAQAPKKCKEIIGYYPAWQQYKRKALFHQKNLDFSKYTIINFAFFYPTETGEVIGTDPWGDGLILNGKIDWANTTDEKNPALFPYTDMVSLAHRGGAKVMFSLGGWTKSTTFPMVAADSALRVAFAASCVKACERYDLDGIDLDWEFPGAVPGNGVKGGPEDTENFTKMITVLRDSLDNYGKRINRKMLLTAAFHSVPSLAKHIDWNAAEKYLDYLNFFGYDFYGAWDPVTNHNAPLYAPEVGDAGVNQNDGFKLITETHGVNPEKIVLGIGFYGRTFTGMEGGPALHVAHSGQVDKDMFPEDEGQPSYYNIILKASEYERKWDDKAKVPYMLGKKANSMVSYDDPESVRYKCEYINAQRAAGCLIWEISQDLIETYPGSGIIRDTPLIDQINESFDSYNCIRQ